MRVRYVPRCRKPKCGTTRERKEGATVDVPEVRAGSLHELRAIEREATARLNQEPTVARLFLNAPVQALAAVGIVLSSQAVDEWTELVGALPSLTDDHFAVRRRSTDLDVVVVIHGILPPGAMRPDQPVAQRISR
jgi:hypothetical protein